MGYKDVVEACAQTLLTRASLIGSRTNSGKILCILAEELRNGLWEKVADVEGIDWQDRPVPLLLHCPLCNTRHIDIGEFATKSHHTHACQSCGHCWRPAIVPTCGVQFLPACLTGSPCYPATRGFKNV